MARANGEVLAPSGARMVLATLLVASIIAVVWWVIEYRQQPPPPPHKIGERVPND